MEEIKNSGKQVKFNSGMVRDINENKPRFDLIFPENIPYNEQVLYRWALHMAKGAVHYGDRNWEKASTREELNRFKESAFRHFFQWYCEEYDEDHMCGIFFNITGYEMVKSKMNWQKAGSPPEEKIYTEIEALLHDDASTGAVEYLRQHPLFPSQIKKLHFLLDMDGVICDFVSGAIIALNKKLNKNYTIKQYADEFGKWETYDFYRITEQTFWDILHAVPNFWSKLKPLPWAIRLYTILSGLGEVTIITTPSDGFDCVTQKLLWLDNYFGIKPPQIFVGSKKYLMAGNGILIDDNEDNVNKFITAGGEAILVPSTWNNAACNLETVWSVIQKYLDLKIADKYIVTAE